MSGAVSVAVAVTAIAVAAEVGTTLAVIAAVGATVSAVGAITKVKELQYAGMAIGAVGAIGGLASAAGMFSSAAELGGAVGAAGTFDGINAASNMAINAGADLASGAAGAAGSFDALSSLPSNAFDSIVDGLGNVGDLTTAAAPVVSAASSPTVSSVDGTDLASPDGFGDDVFSRVTGNVGGADGGGTSLINQGTPAAPGTTVPVAPDATAVPTLTPDPAAPGGATSGIGGMDASGPPGGIPDSGNAAWAGVWDFVKKNQTLVGGVLQAGGSFLSGATNPLTPAQIKAMEAQSKANQAAANKANAETSILEMQRANMGQPLPTATRVTGRPVGMINQPMVTGVAA